jgi:hypothetical protein
MKPRIVRGLMRTHEIFALPSGGDWCIKYKDAYDSSSS